MQKFYQQRQISDYPLVRPYTAGIVIEATHVHVAIPTDGATTTYVEQHLSYTEDLQKLASDLKAKGIQHIALTVAGSYWFFPYNLFCQHGFEVAAVHPAQLKNNPLNEKGGCQLLQRLHSLGLTRPSVVPDELTQRLRRCTRQKENLIYEKGRYIGQIKDLLSEMNIKLPHSLSDLEGKVAMEILKAIAKGESDPWKLAMLRYSVPKAHRIKARAKELRKALQGNFNQEHVMCLDQLLDLYNLCKQKMQQWDAQIEQVLAELPSAPVKAADKQTNVHLPVQADAIKEAGHKSKGKPRQKGKNQHKVPRILEKELQRITGVDVGQLEGISIESAVYLLAELGNDLSKWPGRKALKAWLRLVPKTSSSSEQSIRRRKTTNRAGQRFRLIARGVHRAKSSTGEFYRQTKKKTQSAGKTINIVAQKLADNWYTLLRHGEEQWKKEQRLFEQKYPSAECSDTK